MRLDPADPDNLFILQDMQQLGLQLERHVADFVQEQGSLVRQFEQPHFAAGRRPGERPLLVSEQFRFQQGGGNRGAIDLDEGLVLPRTVQMDLVGHHFLADTGFAMNENSHIEFGNLPDQLQHLDDLIAAANQVLAHDLVAQMFDLLLFSDLAGSDGIHLLLRGFEFDLHLDKVGHLAFDHRNKLDVAVAVKNRIAGDQHLGVIARTFADGIDLLAQSDDFGGYGITVHAPGHQILHVLADDLFL